MTRYRLNTHLAGWSLLVVALFAGGTHWLHGWQMKRHAADQLARADEAEERGEQGKCTASLGRYLAFEPDDTEVRVRHAMLLAKQAANHRQRLVALVTVRGLLPPRGGNLALRLEAVDLALAVNAPAEACKLLEPAVEAFPGRADLHEKLAVALEADGQHGPAAESLETVLKLAPDRPVVAESLARLYRDHLHQSKRAAGVLDRLVQRNPGLPGAYAMRARDLMRRGQIAAADTDLIAARKLDETSIDVLTASAELCRRRGQPNEAATFIDQALLQQPEDPALTVALAEARCEQGKAAEAIELLQQARAKRPEDASLTFALAEAYLARDDWAEAGKWEAALPRQAAGRKLYLSSRIAMGRQQPALAIRSLVQARAEKDVPPDRVAPALVKALGELGYHAEQVQAARVALIDAISPARRVEMARILVAAGHVREVATEVRQLAALHSPPVGVWLPLARVQIDRELERPAYQRNWRDAERSLDRAEDATEDLARAALMRADLWLTRERPTDAAASLDLSRRQNPDEPALWQAQADLATRQGKPDLARSLLDEADQRFANRVDWLLPRAVRLAREQGSNALPALADIEKQGTDLTAADRDQLVRALAEIHYRLGNFSASDRLGQQILEGAPNDLRAALLVFETHLARRDDAEAEKALALVKKLEGDDGPEAKCGQAALLLLRGVRDGRTRAEARRMLTAVAKARPSWTQPLVLLGRLDELEQKPVAALASYQEVLALGDAHPVAIRRALALLLAQDRENEADRIFEMAAKREALDRDLIRPAAEVALRVNRPDRAVQLARWAVSLKKPNHLDYVWLGRILGAAGRHLEADEAFDEAIHQAPQSAEVWLALIGHRHRQGKPGEAEWALSRMQGSVPEGRLPLAQARAYEALDRPADAEKAYREILADQPRDAEVLRRLARLYQRTNQPRQAERVLIALLDPRVLVPEEELPELRRQLALAITSPGQLEDRVEQGLALLDLNRQTEGDNEADRRTAALVKGTRPAQRLEALKVLESLPGGAASLAEERLRLAELYEGEGKWSSARKQLATLLTQDRNNSAYLAAMIEGLLRQNKRTEAAQWLAKLAALEPDATRTQKLGDQLRKPTKRGG